MIVTFPVISTIPIILIISCLVHKSSIERLGTSPIFIKCIWILLHALGSPFDVRYAFDSLVVFHSSYTLDQSIRQRSSLALPGPHKETCLRSSEHKVTAKIWIFQNHLIPDMCCSTVYCTFVLHRRTDLWGPDGKKIIHFRAIRSGLMSPHSKRVRPRSLPGLPEEIPDN